MKRISRSAQETEEIGYELGLSLNSKSILLLYGDLGAGKTTFIKGLVRSITSISSREVTSPTFTYLNIYSGLVPVYHFDLYRLRKEEEFIDMGFEEYFDEEGICCIEWPERIPSLLPKKAIIVHLSYLEEDATRQIEVFYEKNSF